MDIKDISTPEVYRRSADFRFFIDWFSECLTKIKFDTENFFDLYDPLRCPEDLIWALADTMGYKYDTRLPASFNRLVLLYFMSMIRNRGSKDGMVLAAETNLAQFHIFMDAAGYIDEDNIEHMGKEILYNRLEDTSIPINSAYVTPYVDAGYIDVVYFATKVPVDACIEYVRPVGMYVFQHAGVSFDARTKISVDARLTDSRDSQELGLSAGFGPTQVGHYSREDYARLQKSIYDESTHLETNDENHIRSRVWKSNSEYESDRASRNRYNPGYRALYSLQLANNEHIVKSLIDPIFSIGFGPDNVVTEYADDYLKYPFQDKYANGRRVNNKPYNLRYDKPTEESITLDVYTVENVTDRGVIPAVNPVMSKMGDAISLESLNTQYTVTKSEDESDLHIEDINPITE